MTDDKSLVPKLRFPGFTGAWQRRKVGEFLVESRIPGTNGATAHKLTVKLWGKGVVPKHEVYSGSAATNYFVRHAGQFIYGKLDFLHQAFGIVPGKLDGYESTQDSPAFDFLNGVNPVFFLERISRKSFYLYQGMIANGSRKAKRIHEDTFLSMPLVLPRKKEQDAIAKFFATFDDLVILQQHKLSHLEQLKKGLLQKMFPKPGESYPEIRFPGFTGAWQQRKLGEVIQLVGGGTPSKANPSFWKGNIVWLSSQEIKKRFIDHGTFKISQVAVEKSATKLVSAGTPLIVYRSGILAHSFPITRPTISVAINQDIKALLFDKMMLKQQFVVSQLESREQFILKNIVKTGTTVQSVNIPDFVRMTFLIPSVEEQSKLSDLFNGLDDLIALRRRKLSHLQQLKKALLQQMFV